MHLVWFPALFVNEEICLIADTKVLGNVFYVFDNRCEENTYYYSLYFFRSTHLSPDNDFAVAGGSTGGVYFAGCWQQCNRKTFL